MAQSKVLESRKVEIVAAYNEGMNVAELAKEFEVSRPTVYRILSEQGVELRYRHMGAYEELGEERTAEFIKRYSDNEPIKKLLTEFGITHNQMYSLLDDNGIRPRTRQRQISKARSGALDHAVDLYENSNLTLADILAETGVHQPQLHSEIHKRGIQLRRHKLAEARKAVYGESAESETPSPIDGSVVEGKDA